MTNSFDEIMEVYPVFQFVATLVLIVLYFIFRNIVYRVVNSRDYQDTSDIARSVFIKRIVNMVGFLALSLVMGMIWEISWQGLSIYLASFFTVIGVGLVATWSLISNITSSLILYFFFPFKVGSIVRIVDGDNSAKGVVIALTPFSIRILKDDGNEIYYPNNVAIQKSIVHFRKEEKED